MKTLKQWLLSTTSSNTILYQITPMSFASIEKVLRQTAAHLGIEFR